MIRNPYTTIQKIMTLLSAILMIASYVCAFLGVTHQENAPFLLVIFTIIFVLTLFFELYPQITNIVTSKKYNKADESGKARMENNLRAFICILRLAIVIFFLIEIVV